jgi:hypothetical protein
MINQYDFFSGGKAGVLYAWAKRKKRKKQEHVCPKLQDINLMWQL